MSDNPLPINPNWIVKEIGDLQTAAEMNVVMGALKNNAVVLTNLRNKIGPTVSLLTEAQIHSNAINELYNRFLAAAPIWFYMLPNGVKDFPTAKKGDMFAIRIFNIMAGGDFPDGSAWLGGYGGVSVGHYSLMIAMQDTPGGAYSQVGHHFLLINQKKQDVIQYYDYVEDFPPNGKSDIVYVALESKTTYYWDINNNEYVPIGETIGGTLINNTTFHDLDGNTVIPSGVKIYIDTTSNKTYRWNGAIYVEISSGQESKVVKHQFEFDGINPISLPYASIKSVYSLFLGTAAYYDEGVDYTVSQTAIAGVKIHIINEDLKDYPIKGMILFEI